MPKKPTKKTEFKPTKGMIKWLNSSVEIGLENISDVSRHCGVDRSRWYDWVQDSDFIEWFRREWNNRLGVQSAYLDSVGLRQAKRDYKYWEGMQKRIGNLTDRLDVTSGGKPIPILGGLTRDGLHSNDSDEEAA
jgi:hypothetical protein